MPTALSKIENFIIKKIDKIHFIVKQFFIS